ncbi:hypothetical protein SteCoe_5187 [Stentor coeruleus]|uniref:AMP deaminase n=1 Tax=Stentor coeruleus TaxID=5963 RepID=A0A1R2CSV7_9CILI|nr:hypothetical protein SteCoe_5187 [Stentor coeruleus]
MKRPVGIQAPLKSPRSSNLMSLSPTDIFNDVFDPFDPIQKEKSLRTAPRKISNIDESELVQFDKWLSSEEAKKDQTPDLNHQERKNRSDKVISWQDQAIFASNAPIYRKISFTPIPTQFKPQYEKEETFLACTAIEDLMCLRQKYVFYDDYIHQHPLLRIIRPAQNAEIINKLKENIDFTFTNGVVSFANINLNIVPKSEFYQDMMFLMENTYSTVNKSFCYLRLKMLLKKYNIHLQCNLDRESFHQKSQSRKDFYNIIKVDNHVHLYTCMNQKHLQKFIKTKLLTEPNTIVSIEGEHKLGLIEVMNQLGYDASTLTVDVVDSYNNRNERYANKYNPLSRISIRDIFLSSSNFIEGRYFAELVKEVFQNLDKEKYVLAEFRISICGQDKSEWAKTAHWLKNYNIKSSRVRWAIQVPRLYSEFRKKALISNFNEMLNNIFTPLVQASLQPENYPEIAQFLKKVVAFDLVNDEEKNEKIKSFMNYKIINPEEWDCDEEPTYSYWSYYIYANLIAINHLRRARGMNTFAFRPHCGEAGSNDHLGVGYLLANSINHGIKLSKIPVLQYLFYMNQIGISISPLSNNKLFVKFLQNPLPKFFSRGLNVSLSTDDPLSIHLTREPLMEEYSVAAQTLDLNGVDLCEIARNSVLQSGFSIKKKKRWLGESFLMGVNDSTRSNLSSIRFTYRTETYVEEHRYLKRHAYNEDDF